MKKAILLNSNISDVISRMGHTDKLVVADAGLPIDDFTPRIDLAIKKDLPSFIEVLDVILEELKVEEMIIAKEIKKNNLKVLKDLEKRVAKFNIKILWVSHEEFKEETLDAKAIVRTGECSPYANVILKSGVTF